MPNLPGAENGPHNPEEPTWKELTDFILKDQNFRQWEKEVLFEHGDIFLSPMREFFSLVKKHPVESAAKLKEIKNLIRKVSRG